MEPVVQLNMDVVNIVYGKALAVLKMTMHDQGKWTASLQYCILYLRKWSTLASSVI